MISKILYWASTAVLCGLMLFSAKLYIIDHEMLLKAYDHLGYPGYLLYPMAIAKIAGVIAILSKLSPTLKEWAYAGFCFDLILAVLAHWMVGELPFRLSTYGLIALVISYFFDRRLYKNPIRTSITT